MRVLYISCHLGSVRIANIIFDWRPFELQFPPYIQSPVKCFISTGQRFRHVFGFFHEFPVGLLVDSRGKLTGPSYLFRLHTST